MKKYWTSSTIGSLPSWTSSATWENLVLTYKIKK